MRVVNGSKEVVQVTTPLGTVTVRSNVTLLDGRACVLVDVSPEARSEGEGPPVHVTTPGNVRLIEHKDGVPDVAPEGSPLYQRADAGRLVMTNDTRTRRPPEGAHLPTVARLRAEGRIIWGDRGPGNIQIFFWDGRHFAVDYNAPTPRMVAEL